MARYWTSYWQFRYWRPDVNNEGEPVWASGSNNFHKRGVSVGDSVYIISQGEGQLYLGGRMTVKQILSRAEAVRLWNTDRFYEAADYIFDPEKSGTLLDLHRRLSPTITKKLRFESKTGPKEPFFVSDTELDKQATRGVRELTSESAALLDRIIAMTDSLPKTGQVVTVINEMIGPVELVEKKNSYLLTWNPAVWNGEFANPIDWSCGNSKQIKTGDRLFAIRQGVEPRGIVASGRSLSDVFEDKDGTRRVRMEMDTLLDAESEEIFSRDWLIDLNVGLSPPMNWSVQISGTRIPTAVAERLETAWSEFLAGRLPPTDEIRQALQYPEGAVRQITVNAYERNSEARRSCIEYYGESCIVCEMSFRALYGPLAEGFIHVHHLKPLSEVGEEYVVDPIADMRPVCPNCHAVLHLGGQLRSIAEVKEFLAANKCSVV